MKKLSWITGILVFITVLLAGLGSMCGAVDQLAGDEQFYSGMSRAAVAKYLNVENDPQINAKITEYIGLSDEEQSVLAKEMAAFMRGETDVQPAVLNEKEQQHMLDVRQLTQAAAGASKTCMTLAAVLAVAAAWTGARLKRRVLPKFLGALAAAGMAALAAAFVLARLRAGGFAGLFIAMHEMLFTNDLWLMNPETDILIRMMPQPLFEQALADGVGLALRMLAVVLCMLSAVHVMVEGMIRRQVEKGE